MAALNDTQVNFFVITFFVVALAANGSQAPQLRTPQSCKSHDVPDLGLFVNCEFSHLDNHETFKELDGAGINFLNVYFKDDIFDGVLPDNTFKQMQGITSIVFFGYYPRNISKRAFAGLKDLEWLSIGRVGAQVFYGEQVTGLPLSDALPLQFDPGWLNEIPTLTNLDLAYNNISAFPKGHFCGLKDLGVLSLGNNSLKFPGDIGISNTHNSSQYPGCLAKLTNLDLSRNHLVSLRDTLGNLQSLIDLQVQYNQLESIDDICGQNDGTYVKGPSFLPCFPTLFHLDLSHNHIRELRSMHPCNSSKLGNLYIQNNRLEYISPGFFTCNRNLRNVDLSANSLINSSLVDTGIGDLDQLEFLNLSGNSIQTLNAILFSNLGKLNKFICSNCHINIIEDNVFENTWYLKIINLCNNSIQFIDSRTFIYLQQLQTLDLSNNKLQAFTSAKVLSLLTSLYLSRNYLQKVPDFSGKWSSLTHLDLSRNNITEIEQKGLHGLSRLQSLKLGFNQIKYVPLNVFSSFAKQLETLDMEGNCLFSINVSTISELTELTDLNLANNNIQTIGFWLSYGGSVPPLRHLNMSGNSIREISSEYFPDTLEIIDLSWNLIAKVQSPYKLPRLLQLNLTYNRLYELGPSSFDMVSRKEPRPQILLGGNMVHCDCQIDWLRGINTEKGIWPEVPDLDLVYCKTPQRNGNRSLSAITSSELLCPYSDCDQRTCRCCAETEACPCYFSCLRGCSCYRGSEESKVNIMNCTSRNVTGLPFGLFSSSEAIHLDGNNLSEFQSSNFHFPQVMKLFLNKSHITNIKVGACNRINTIQELFLQDNDIQEISQLSLRNLTQLESVYLQNNRIQLIETDSFYRLDSLNTLWLHNNSLTHINTTIFDKLKSLGNLTLHGNPWQCDCKTGPQFQRWLTNKSKIISNIGRITCRFRTSDQIILDIDFSTCQPSWKVKGLTLLSFTLVIIGCLIAVIYRKRLLVKILLYNHYGWYFRRSSDNDSDKRYDVFIAHAEEDEDFVLEKILPELEERERPYKVCLEMRDCLAGTVITEFIVSAIQNSKRTVLVVSENYFKSKLAQYMFQVAHYQVLADRQRRLIPVLVGEDVEGRMSSDLHLYVVGRAHLRYGDMDFWYRLKYYLGDKVSPSPSDSSA